MSVTRRGVMKGGAVGAMSLAMAGSLDAIFQTSAVADTGAGEAYGYGPLVPDPKGVLDLPRGFSYKELSVEGDVISDGVRVPGRHDAMGTFPTGKSNELLVVRNHEQTASGVKAVAPDELVYDPEAFGGTTTMLLKNGDELRSQYVSLAGTSTNCAGGVTPWGTWLTCEETEGFGGESKSHGWVFEVDPYGRRTRPEPLKEMGRFAHEAVCVDPHTLTAYLTEDASGPFGMFYRFRPRAHRGDYHAYMQGGRLEVGYIRDVPDLALIDEPGTKLHARWKAVPDKYAKQTSIREQFGDEITRTQKLEGCWWGHGKAWFVASFANKADGAARDHKGQVWTYDPKTNEFELQLIFRNDSRFDGPDNITVSPYGGGVIIAEDGDGTQHLVGTTKDNKPFAFARNAANDSEFCGVTFSPDGRTLYANRQSGPGVTFAITGPWNKIRG
ncbi:alkaline phosphatase PhoX [Actinomadura rifamycini]|uniref:alkaline phosphatase PhoX n=1 Tax=Actinomadura rifamycini TaxID=31962 RepID=UPI00040E420C|nr:alkaline phosphatase PhoX [Actinomadura rifamycini]